MDPLTRVMTCFLLLVICPQALAQASAGSEQPSTKSSLPNDAPNFDAIRSELEQVRQDLGAEYSLESKELGISFDRNESPQGGSVEQPGLSNVDQQLLAISKQIQIQARQLEQLAADAETRTDYQLADRLRELAEQQWKSARAIRSPLSTSPLSLNGCGNVDCQSNCVPLLHSLSEPIPPGVNGPGPGVVFPFFSYPSPPAQTAPASHTPEN